MHTFHQHLQQLRSLHTGSHEPYQFKAVILNVVQVDNRFEAKTLWYFITANYAFIDTLIFHNMVLWFVFQLGLS